MTHADSCKNCSTPIQGNYCHQCGQITRSTDRFFLTLVNEAFEDIFSLNSRVWKTFGNLLWRPGFLSTEYFAGRRVRYIPPVRLYFTLSILFFVLYSISSFFQPPTIETAAVVQNEASEAPGADPQVPTNDNQDKEPFEAELFEEGGFNVPWLSEERNQALEARFKSQVEKAKAMYELNPDAPAEYFRDIAPPVIFCLLPLFALLLKVFYVFKGMYYTQHLVLAVHDHCFVFLWLSLNTLIDWILLSFGGTPGWLNFLMFAWFVIYLWLSLRVVYQQGRFMTTVKFMLLAISYLFLAFFALAGAMVFGIMTV